MRNPFHFLFIILIPDSKIKWVLNTNVLHNLILSSFDHKTLATAVNNLRSHSSLFRVVKENCFYWYGTVVMFSCNSIWFPIHMLYCLTAINNKSTLKSLIEEHTRLDFSDFLSTLLAIFYAINKKFHPARLLIYLVNK
mgnify:CR=1 FL=1